VIDGCGSSFCRIWSVAVVDGMSCGLAHRSVPEVKTRENQMSPERTTYFKKVRFGVLILDVRGYQRPNARWQSSTHQSQTIPSQLLGVDASNCLDRLKTGEDRSPILSLSLSSHHCLVSITQSNVLQHRQSIPSVYSN